MQVKAITDIKTVDEARQEAIDWQAWMSENNVSYGDLVNWNKYFTTIAKRFDLVEEFQENGVI